MQDLSFTTEAFDSSTGMYYLHGLMVTCVDLH